MNDALAALEKQYFFLNDSLSDLIDKGATEDELNSMRAAVVQSRTNYWRCISRILHNDDPAVKELTTRLNLQEIELEHAVKTMSGVAQILNVVTEAVSIGSQLAALAIAL